MFALHTSELLIATGTGLTGLHVVATFDVFGRILLADDLNLGVQILQGNSF